MNKQFYLFLNLKSVVSVWLASSNRIGKRNEVEKKFTNTPRLQFVRWADSHAPKLMPLVAQLLLFLADRNSQTRTEFKKKNGFKQVSQALPFCNWSEERIALPQNWLSHCCYVWLIGILKQTEQCFYSTSEKYTVFKLFRKINLLVAYLELKCSFSVKILCLIFRNNLVC